MKKIVFSLFLLFGLLNAQSQDPNGIQMPQIIPPNPVAMQYQKFVGYPVDASTGLVNVSIPLYNLALPGITIPFSLKYHASGIKVEDTYGSLGYGWSFFPGFRITRTVMGKLDEYFHTDNIQSLNTATVSNYTDYLANMATPASENDEVGTTADGQFDIFSIHLPTYDGGFILKWENNVLKVVPIPDAPLKINIVYAGAGSSYIGGFTVTDDKGIQYLFGNAFSATNNEYSEGNDVYATGWMLRKIILPGVSDTLLFHYNSVGAPNLSPSCNSIILYDNFVNSSSDSDPDFLRSALGMSGECGDYTQSSVAYCGFDGTLRSFQSLEFSTGKVVVSYVPNSINMQSMAVVNSQQDTVKKIVFTQQNLLLTKVSISGEGEYSMQYKDGFVDPQDGAWHPAVYQQDRWGFFNGQRNTSLLPSIPLHVTCGSSSGTLPVGTANRDVDTAAMQANMLQNITYPTGGRTTFFYEAHAFGSYYSPTLGGGLRIKQMDTYDPVSGKTITKTYKYGRDENGLGDNSGFYPADGSFIDEKYLYAQAASYVARCRRQTLNQHSKWRFFGFNLPVWYSEVAEYSDGGKTIYNYDYAADIINTTYPSTGYDFWDSPVFSSLTDVLQTSNNIMMGAPSLTQKRVYKNEYGTYTLVHEDDYNYASYNSSQVHGLIVEPLAYVMAGSAPRNYFWKSDYYYITGYSYGQSTQTIWPFTYYDYYIVTGKNNLYSTVQHDYSNGVDIAVTVNNDYDNSHPYNLTFTQNINSKGDTITEKYYYPTSSSIPGISALTSAQQQMITMLKDSNRVTTLIQKSSFKNGSTPLFSSLYGYKNWGNGILQPEQTYTKTGSKAYESRLRFYNYDNKRNVLSVSKENDIKMTYLWGYNKTYPVAQITGADYATASGIINQSILDNPQSDQQLRDELNKLRTQLSPAQVITYTYKPLVGVTSVTDIKGLTSYYEYDSFNRLKLIRDKDGNILKTFSYQYKEQQ